MGIQDLWSIIEPAAQSRLFTELAVIEGYQFARRGNGRIVLGIDASMWLSSCQAVWEAVSSSRGPHAGLLTLFHKLCRLLRLPITPVFVFDGPGRPSIKRGRLVGTNVNSLTESFIALISTFGFHSHIAPGEAEAELANLNRLEMLDAVMTGDSDIFVFGATCVIRNPTVKTDGDCVKIYTASALRETRGVSLSQGGLLLIALLCGGDYNKIGLRGCGKVAALELAHLGFGDNLFDVATGSSPDDLHQFLTSWRQDLRSALLSDQLSHRHPAAASAITEAFPKVSVILLYVHPLTSWSPEFLGSPPNGNMWAPRLPNLPELARLCKSAFSWGTFSALSLHFNPLVWEGVFLQRLYQAPNILDALKSYASDSGFLDEPPSLSSYLKIRRTTSRHSLALTFKFHLVDVTLEHVCRLAFSSLVSSSGSSCQAIPQSLVVAVPAPLLERVLPSMVAKMRPKRQQQENAGHACLVSPIFQPVTNTVEPELVSIAGPSSMSVAKSSPNSNASKTPVFLGYLDLTCNSDSEEICNFIDLT